MPIAVINFRWQVPGQIATGGKPSCVEQVDWLREQGIGAVVSLVLVPDAVTEEFRRTGINHLSMPISDYEDVARDPYAWGQFSRFIHANIYCGRAVYIHCAAGVRRSVRLAERYARLGPPRD